MMLRLLIAVPVMAIGVALAVAVQRRRMPDAPTAPAAHEAPVQLDLGDFEIRDAEVYVVVFSSKTCDGCFEVINKAKLAESELVQVIDCEFSSQPKLHEKYAITAVPTTAVATPDGVVQRSFLGSVSVTHLWGAIAEVRHPGSIPPGCSDHDHH